MWAGIVPAVVLCWLAATRGYALSAASDHQHDFDFEFGSWTASLKMLPDPFGARTHWVTFSGSSVVHELLGGRENIGELQVANSRSRIDGLSIRIYDPKAQQWNVYFANAKGGSIDTIPMVGRFCGGRGEFHATETIDNRQVGVRFIFSNLTANAFDFNQAFSTDGGNTWSDNWIAHFTKS